MAKAEALMADAPKARKDGHPDNAAWIERRALAYAAAAGYLHLKEHTVTDTFTTITPDIERDRNGRPWVINPDGKRVTYRRCTTYIGVLDDKFKLGQWQQRMVALGLADRPDYLLGVAAHRDDKDKLNSLCEEAATAAKAHAAADIGTAVHKLSHTIDRGQDPGIIPQAYQGDLAAYKKATAGIQWLAIERGVLIDDMKVHGTPDRVGRLPDGRVVIADLKTGSLDFSINEISMQLAMYAHANMFYDHATRSRVPVIEGIDQSVAVVIHLPAGSGKCELLEVDIAAGWEGVQVAAQVWEWRSRKNLARPYASGFPTSNALTIFDFIAACDTADECRALFTRYEAQWLPAHTEAAKARIDSLAASAA